MLTFPLTIGDTTHSMLAISETDLNTEHLQVHEAFMAGTLYTTTEWENEERDMCIECSEVMTMVATVAGKRSHQWLPTTSAAGSAPLNGLPLLAPNGEAEKTPCAIAGAREQRGER